MTVIYMRAAALPLHELAGGAVSERDREFRGAVRTALEDSGLRVIEVFTKGAVPQTLPEILLDGTVERTSYITVTAGIDIDATIDEIEQVFSNLSVPGFAAVGWRYPEE